MAQLKVFDILGKEVMQLYSAKVQPYNIYEISLNGKSLSNGVYMLRLHTLRGKDYVTKLVVLK